jgi:GT2 family glycosyltransferase/glycosyltransferase involved in cell wall biosynthesis
LRVLFITNGFPPSEIGGTEVLARNVGRQFLENGDEVIVFAPAYTHQQEYDSLLEGMRIHRVPAPSGRAYSFTYVDGTVDLKFASFLLEAKPEVAIVWHTINLSARILEILDRIGVPYILYLSDFHFLCNQTHLLTTAMEPCDGPEDGTKCEDCIAATVRELIDREGRDPAKLGRLRVSIMRRLLGFAKRMVAPSEFVKEKYVEFGLDAENISIIPLGVDVKSIRSTFKPVASERLRFGYFGGNSALRGISDVLEAFHTIKDPSIELVLAGQALNEIPPEDLPANTRIIGRYIPDEVGRVLSEIDVLLIPSRCHESYSLVAREAAAVGIPIIVSDLRAQSDALQDGVNGLCFKAGEPADLAAKVLLLRNDAKLLQSLREPVTRVRSIEQTATEFQKLCRDLVRTNQVTTREMEHRLSSFLNEGIDRIEEERRALDRVNHELSHSRTELLAIQDSFGYKAMRFYASGIDRLLPEGTRRGEFRKVVIASLRVVTEQGTRSYLYQAWEKIRRRETRIIEPASSYGMLAETARLSQEDIDRIRRKIPSMTSRPVISVITPVYNTDARWLKRCLDSVLNQVYSQWELCIADDASDKEEVRTILQEYASKEPRIKLELLEKHLGVAGSSNAALDSASGDFVLFLDHDDELTPDAIFEVAETVSVDSDVDLIYSDEDKIDEKGRYTEPFYKPDFSFPTLRSQNYLIHLAALRRDLVVAVNGLDSEFDGAQDYDLFFRVLERTQRVHHIAKILYHWRKSSSSGAKNALAKPWIYKKGKLAVQRHLTRLGYNATVEMGKGLGLYNVNYQIEGTPVVDILIPTRKISEVKECLTSLINMTTWENRRIFAVINAKEDYDVVEVKGKHCEELDPSTDRETGLIGPKLPYNWSRMNNRGMSATVSPYVVFLNDDTRIISRDWIQDMLQYAQLEDVGAVGAMLLYPDGTIQHAGDYVTGTGMGGHCFNGMDSNSFEVNGLAQCIRETSAVTGACMMVRRTVFEELGGFDEELRNFDDFDFCLRLREKGYKIIYTPYAKAYHLESPSRPQILAKKMLHRLSERHPWARSDPFYRYEYNAMYRKQTKRSMR